MIINDIEAAYNSPSYMMSLSRKGLSFQLFTAIAHKCTFSMQQWSDFLHLNLRTLQRYKKENKTFERIQSERILEIARLQKRGEEVFEDKALFDKWMLISSVALGNAAPIDLMGSSFGIDMINDELTRIEHGVLA